MVEEFIEKVVGMKYVGRIIHVMLQDFGRCILCAFRDWMAMYIVVALYIRRGWMARCNGSCEDLGINH